MRRRTGLRVLSVEYALAPEEPFPAGLIDAVAAYRGLLATGVPAHDVVFAGESAGAGLVLQTLLSLREQRLPQPAVAWLVSPWADLSLSGSTVTSRTPHSRRPRSRPAAGTTSVTSRPTTPG